MQWFTGRDAEHTPSLCTVQTGMRAGGLSVHEHVHCSTDTWLILRLRLEGKLLIASGANV